MVVLTLWACSGGTDVTASGPTPVDASWVGEITKNPKLFEDTIADSRSGWIALHKNDWTDAVAAGGAPAKRAAAELAVFHAVLADTSNEAWRALGTTWERRGSLPTDSALPRLVALAAKDAGDTTAQARWERLPGREDPAIVARVALHQEIRRGSRDLAPLIATAGRPMIEEPITGGVRPFWDPLLHHTLSQHWTQGAVEAYPTGLAAALFSGGLDATDGSPAATLARIGRSPPTSDDADACRESIRAFDVVLDGWKAAQVAANPPGSALLTDLRLVEGLRSRALVDWGVDALSSDRPRCALATVEMALDHEAARAITPINSPTLYAVMAQANLRTGRTREALDALEVLVHTFPEVAGLDETVGDLAVLEGLDRTGDSREN